MPEGPEIKRVADELAAVLVGEKVVEVTFAFAHLKGYEKELTGRRVRQVRPRGKALLTEFNGGLTIYSHNQLYGRWVIVERGQIPQTDRQLRLALHTKEHACLLYSASDIELLDKEGVACHSFLNRLGPDVLETTEKSMGDRYGETAFQGRQLGALLLDQNFLAGLGNYLRSEILFMARVYPLALLGSLDKKQRAALAQQTLRLTRQSYKTEGVTNDLKSYKILRRAGRSFAQSRYWVFDREGEPCYECGTAVVKTSVSGRRLYYCLRCQVE
ncbi:MAG: endonuclease VIII [Candidatus Latescibacterota bacterium]|jgi:endonuclease-8